MEGNLPEGWTVFRLPRSHWHCTLWAFEWAGVHPPSLHTRITEFLHQIQDAKAPHLLLTGAPGVGKTHIGIAVYRVASAVFGTAQVTWLNVPAFCEQVKQGYGADGIDPWPDVEDATRLVVLDDLFGRVLSQHEASQIVYRLIDTASRNGAAVLATMNQDAQTLHTMLPGHEISRLLADAIVIPLKATKDWRRG